MGGHGWKASLTKHGSRIFHRGKSKGSEPQPLESSPQPSRPSLPTQDVSVPANTEGKCRSPDDTLWIEAFQRLLGEDQKRLFEHVSLEPTEMSTIPMDILESIQDKRKQCEEKKLTMTVGNKTIDLKDIANEALDWLEKFKGVMDVAVSADPMHAALPWAGVKVILEAAGSDRKQTEALVRGLNRIFYLIYRCQLYEVLMYESSGQAKQNLHEALLDFYTAVWAFMAKAIHFDSRRTALRVLGSLWTSDGIQNFEDQCKDLEERVEKEAQNCDRQQRSKMWQHLKAMPKMEGLMDSMNRILKAMWKKMEQDEIKNMLMWISEIPYKDHHKDASKDRTPVTGDWIFEHRQYREWEKLESAILWLHGIPGAGKTKLVSRIIDRIQESEITLAYFYCNRNYESRREPTNILQSYIKQLSTSKDGLVQQVFADVYQTNEKRGRPSSKLDLEECKELLPELLRPFSRVVLILDALDETHDNNDRAELLRTLEHLIEQSNNLKVIVASRRDDSIARRLEKGANLSIEATDNARDIMTFVQDRIENPKIQRREPISDELKKDIVNVLSAKSNGMFQWAALQIDQIERLKLENDIRERLGKLPEDLKDAYEELIGQIDKTDGSGPKIANSVFKWILFSIDPLSPEDLVGLVAWDIGIRADELGISLIHDACRNLVIVSDPYRRDSSRDESFCQFSHLSVREYLEEYRFHESRNRIHSELATRTIMCLFKSNDKPDQGKNSILAYAANFWHIHAEKALQITEDTELKGLINEFFDQKSPHAYHRWLSLVPSFGLYWFTSDRPYLHRRDARKYNFHQLYYASCLGFEFAVDKILTEHSELLGGAVFEDAIVVAAVNGHTGALRRLSDAPTSVSLKTLHTTMTQIHGDVAEPTRIMLGMDFIRDGQSAPNMTTRFMLAMNLIPKMTSREIEKLNIRDFVKAAVSNDAHGFKIWQYLLEKHSADFPISEDLVELAVSNWECGEEFIQRFLVDHKAELKVTEGQLMAAAANQHIPHKFLMAFATAYPGEMQLTARIMTAAAANELHGDMVIKLLLDNGNCNFDLTEDVYQAVAENKYTGEGVLFHLLNSGIDFPITEGFLKTVAAQNVDLMKVILGQRGEIDITGATLHQVAWCRNWSANEMTEILLTRQSYETSVIVQLLEGLVQIHDFYHAVDRVECVLRHYGDKITVSVLKNLVNLVTRNTGRSGDYIMKLLFDHAGSELTISQDMVKVVAGNTSRHASHMLKLLLNHTGSEFPISDDLVKEAAGNTGEDAHELVRVLLEHKGGKITVSEDLIKIVAENRFLLPGCIMKTLLDHACGEIIISEDLMRIVFKDGDFRAFSMLKLLLEYENSKFTISEDSMRMVAADRWHWSEEIMRLFLEHGGRVFCSDVTILEDLLVIVAGSRQGGLEKMEALLEHASDDFTISEDLMKATAESPNDEREEMLELLQSYKSDKSAISDS